MLHTLAFLVFRAFTGWIAINARAAIAFPVREEIGASCRAQHLFNFLLGDIGALEIPGDASRVYEAKVAGLVDKEDGGDDLSKPVPLDHHGKMYAPIFLVKCSDHIILLGEPMARDPVASSGRASVSGEGTPPSRNKPDKCTHYRHPF